ncbi:MAG: DUF427 domain-containing protein [Parasphingorhabdus sp.]
MANLSTSTYRATASSAPGFQKHPRYELDIVPSRSLHQLILNEALIAASDRSLIVCEQGFRNVLYVPRDDILIPLTRMKGQSSFCPFKGTATYWELDANGQIFGNAAWSYELPYDEVAPLKGHLAFYLDKLDCYWRNGVEQPLLGPGRCHGEDCFAPIAA